MIGEKQFIPTEKNKNEANEKQEKLDKLFKEAKNEFEKLEINSFHYGELFDKIYTDYSDEEEIVMRDGSGKQLLNTRGANGEYGSARKKIDFDKQDKLIQIGGILGMIDLDFKNLGYGAINSLKRYPAILETAELLNSNLKKIVDEFSDLEKQS